MLELRDVYKRQAYHYLDTFVMVQDSLDASERVSEVQHIVYKNQMVSPVTAVIKSACRSRSPW